MKPRGQPGAFSLIECMVYLGVLGVILGLGFPALFQCQKSSRDLQRNADDMVRALNAGERWREDIRNASGQPVLLANDALQIPRRTGRVLYTFANGSLWRKDDATGRSVEILKGVKSSRMLKDLRQHAASWRWEVELQSPQKTARLRPMFTFQSVARPSP